MSCEFPTLGTAIRLSCRSEGRSIPAAVRTTNDAPPIAEIALVAATLAADIRRHLHHEPVLAGPPSVAYQVRKFAQRNKALLAGTAAVFAALVAGRHGQEA